MTAEIICVGTELLLGDILNSNAQYLGQQLAQLGIPHYYQNVVGDNPDRIKQVVDIACKRSKILIFTGGLGPTPDDLTIETLADFFTAPLIEKSEIIADIETKFAQRGRIMSPSNLKQALIPKGAEILANATGTAPGIIWQPRADNLTILTFPGVPAEMKQMWHDVAVPYLQQQGWCQGMIYSRTLRFWGVSESGLAEKVSTLLALQNPTVAPYASHGEVKLRISARSASQQAASELIDPIEDQIREIAGIDCYGKDEDSLASVAGQLLQQAGETVSVAESCTGGGLGQALTAISGSSGYFWGGIIAYDNSVKIGLLDVNSADLEQLGAVSAVVAEQMAAGVKAKLNTSWGISLTGIAGPEGGTEEKPVGLVYIGIAKPDGTVESVECRFGGKRGRDWVRRVSVSTALDQLRRRLL
ncbi:MAG: competence/damage-inducible protein A [Microcoleaceae cyanobacterium]